MSIIIISEILLADRSPFRVPTYDAHPIIAHMEKKSL